MQICVRQVSAPYNDFWRAEKGVVAPCATLQHASGSAVLSNCHNNLTTLDDRKQHLTQLSQIAVELAAKSKAKTSHFTKTLEQSIKTLSVTERKGRSSNTSKLFADALKDGSNASVGGCYIANPDIVTNKQTQVRRQPLYGPTTKSSKRASAETQKNRKTQAQAKSYSQTGRDSSGKRL